MQDERELLFMNLILDVFMTGGPEITNAILARLCACFSRYFVARFSFGVKFTGKRSPRTFKTSGKLNAFSFWKDKNCRFGYEITSARIFSRVKLASKFEG